MLVDSHCHLDFPDFAEDLDQLVDRAHANDVGVMLTIGTLTGAFDKVAGIAERFDNIWCSVGVHPHEVASEPDIDAERLIELARHPKVIGIGETGLDYYYDNSPRARQRECFRVHIAAARATGLPLIVHSRDADEDTAAILEDEMAKGPFGGVIHCFTAGQGLAERAFALGFYISFSGIVTFNNADDLRAVAKTVPLERLLVETDAPYLAPVPNRGKRNEPEFVRHTAALVAALKAVSLDAFAAATTANFFTLFSKAQAP